jgi:hypothetical protein
VSSVSRIGLWAVGAALGVAACNAKPSEAAPPAASAAVAAPAASAPKASVKPWYAGTFSAEYQVQRTLVEVKAGAVKEWAADDGKAASGPGKLSLQIDDDGVVDGTGEGALGPSHATGKVEDDTLRLQLTPSDQAGLHGILIAGRDGEGFKGTLQASSADSLRVRGAAVELKKLPH